MAKIQKNRALRIGYRVRRNVFRQVKRVPEIKLMGNWLEAAGFAIGEGVEIMVQPGKIIIKNG
ncbi:SymE family type I addiction module toxin [Salmonirosea aquatica]|uniref:Type I addiction module toxin, SymE family n=1 Tax=Salmonirosea aquatica TaxID=2654236 RepID=A0A7C9FFP0_9BACT|nr:type I addiction module toxin, SymE family [Cytophagaceae bacterium SJW1-29]